MAIDTKAKRTSAVGSRRLPWMRRFTPAPDGTVAQADRQSVGFVYGGIASSSSVVTLTSDYLRTLHGPSSRFCALVGPDTKPTLLNGPDTRARELHA